MATYILMQPRVQLAFWDAKTHCWLIFSFLSTNTPKSFSTELLSIYSLPILYSCLGLPWPRCRTLHLALCMRFAWAHLSSLSRSLWMASLPSNISTALRNSIRIYKYYLALKQDFITTDSLDSLSNSPKRKPNKTKSKQNCHHINCCHTLSHTMKKLKELTSC